jgi:peptide/nickel transport system permease protein
MRRYALRRLSFLPIILLAVSLITFMVLRVLPSQDPADVVGGSNATEAQKEAYREQLGLNDPLYRQYTNWLGHALTGDFGKTFNSQKSVRDEFVRRFPASFELVLMAMTFSAFFGISFGILSAMYRNSLLDYAVRIFAVFGASIPEFFLLTLLIIVPSYFWSYSMPLGGYVPIYEDPANNLRLFLPAALILGIGGSSGLMRLTRTTMLEVLRSDYVRTARSKGLRQRTVILTHAMRNAGTPIMTALGTSFILVFSGSVIAEQILSIQGNGLFFFTSTLSRDLPVIQFLAVYTAAVVVIVNLLVDLSYAVVDPRVKYS